MACFLVNPIDNPGQSWSKKQAGGLPYITNPGPEKQAGGLHYLIQYAGFMVLLFGPSRQSSQRVGPRGPIGGGRGQ